MKKKKKKKNLSKYVARCVWAGAAGLQRYRWVDKRGSLHMQEDGDVVAAVVLQQFEVKQKQEKKTLNSVFW